MRIQTSLGALILIATTQPLVAQSRVDRGYQRAPTLRFDPFRHVTIRHWGFSMSASATAENNSFNLEDIGAIILLADDDSLGLGEAIDALGLVPANSGLTGLSEAGARISLGGPIGSRLAVGFSAGARAYGTFSLADDAIALFRDGNTQRQDFSFGDSQGTGIGTAEFGVHATYAIPVSGPAGPNLTVGLGARFLRPVAYGAYDSPLEDGGSIRIPSSQSGTDVSAVVQIESHVLPEISGGTVSDYLHRGSGTALDFLARLDFESGLSLEAMVANVGSITIEGVERSDVNIDASAPTIDQILDLFREFDQTTMQDEDTLSFEVRDTVDVAITLPRVMRVGASFFPMAVLQLDVAITAPVTGGFDTPAIIDVGSTWRLARILPLRAGLVFGGHQSGVGFTGGVAIESRHFLLNLSGGSYGGLFRQATGAGARFEFGVFF